MIYSIWYTLPKTFWKFSLSLAFDFLIILVFFSSRFSLSWTTSIFVKQPECVGSGEELVHMMISGDV